MVEANEKFKRETSPKIFNISYLILGVLIFLTLGVTFNFYKSAKNKDSVRFANQVARYNSAIESRINLYRAMLKGGRGFVETARDLNRKKFASYIESLDLLDRYPGVQGIGYAAVIKTSERDRLTAAMKKDGFDDFKIFPENERGEYNSVIYFEPLNQTNRKIIGFDMASDAVRRAAMLRSGATNEAVMSGKVALHDDAPENHQPGFMIYLPVYQNGKTDDALAEREKNLRGYVYSTFRARNFLNEIQEDIAERDLNVRIYDGEVAPENLLAQTESAANAKDAFDLVSDVYATREEMPIGGGGKWILEYNTLPGFTEQSSVGWTPLIFLCGIGFSFLLFGMSYWEAAARAKVQQSTAELFEMQKEREILFKNEKRARLTAEQANLTKDEFISIVSHELKTPLNAIAGWTRILKTPDVSAPTKELALQKIEKNLRSQAGLVEQLLNYSEIISGKINLKEEAIDLSELFAETTREAEALASEKKIELVKDNHLRRHIVTGDREKLKLAFNNLMSNAVKFTPGGGKVEITFDESDDAAELIIKDTGRGISPDFLPYVFEQYKQAETPNTRDYGGLGLGLTIAKHIINLHRGTILVASDGKGKGAVFTVRIPFENER